MILSRRRALFGLLAAPAIVAAPSLMRVSTLPKTLEAEAFHVVRLDYAGNDTYQRYSGLDVMHVTSHDIIAAHYDWMASASAVTVSA